MPTSPVDKPPICRAPPVSSAEVAATCVDAPLTRPPPSTWHHWIFLGLACGVLAASSTFSIRGQEQVVVPVLNKALPGTCTFRRLTDLPCPGCGMTRAFISTAHGQLAAAWQFNPAGVVFFAVVVFQIPYRVFQIARLRRGLAEYRFAVFDDWVLIAVVVILLLQWVYAVVTCLW